MSGRLELEPARESTSALSASEGVATGGSETAATTTVHHVEKDVGVDVNMGAAHATTHTTHTTEASHAAAHAPKAASGEHFGRVDEVIAVIVRSTFSSHR